MNTFSYRFGSEALTYITTPSNAIYNFGKGDFTIEAWVKTFHGGPVLARKVTGGGSTHGGFFLTLDLNKVIFTADDGSYWNSIEGTASVCDGRWHHIAAVRSGSTGFLYVDGKTLAFKGSGNALPPLNVNSIDRLTIGTLDQTTQPNRFFRGLMAEIRLWNKARTDTEVSQDMYYRLESANLSPNLVGYWTGEFGYTSDLSAYGNASASVGTLSGSGEIPPLRSFRIETFSTIFHGIYDITTSQPLAKQIAVTLGGFAILDGKKVIKAAKVQGTRLTWPALDNRFEADLQFMTWSAGNENQQFQGTLIQGRSQTQIQGNLAPVRVGCGILLNVGTGLVLSCPNAGIGSQVLLAPKDPHTHDHFCRYDSAHILHMHSALALKPGSPTAGAQIFLTNPTIGGPRQSWTMTGGSIFLKANPSLALAGSNNRFPILANVNPLDEAQQWLSLQDSQLLFNGLGGVLAAGSGTQVKVLSNTDGSPAQMWYFFRGALINQLTAQALTATGQINSPLSLARWSSTNTGQQFTITGRQLIHKATGFVVGATSLASQPILQAAGTTGAGTMWSINAPVKLPTTLERHVRDVGGMANDTTYVVSVYTGDYIAAGTNDKVVVVLQSDTHSLPPIELKNNDSGMNPFERAQTDIFTLRNMPNIGTIQAITVHYGDNNWLWNDRWVVDEITVTNKTDNVQSIFIPKGPTAQFEMPSDATFYAWNIRYVGIGVCTMAADMAIAQDPIGKERRWHHTWISVINDGTPQIKTWFDCAGGHEGPETVNNVVTGTCDRQTVVRMSTGYPYSDQRPLREAYGTGRTDGVDNASLRAEGRLNWQGQCHQIANRYLWTCIPSTTLSSVPNAQQPNGYGLSVLAFGTFGIGFTEWVRRIGFDKIGENNETSIYGLVQVILKTAKKTRDVLAWRLDLQNDITTATDPAPAPNGPAVRRFVKRLKDRGLSVSEIAKIANYTEQQINDLLK